MRLFIFLLFSMAFLQGCIITYIGTTKAQTTSSLTAPGDVIRIKRLYVLGYGNLSSKVITNNIYTALNTRLEEKKSAADFEFITIIRDNQKVDINAVPADSYDGYLLISPTQPNSINTRRMKAVTGGPYGSTTWYGNSYDGIFTLTLYNAKKELIYSADLNFHSDPTNDLLFKKITKWLIKELSKSHIHLW